MKIHHALIAAAAVAAIAIPAYAIAQTSAPVPAAETTTSASGGSILSLAAIEQRLAADGFRVMEIERYSRSVEVKGLDRAGACVEMHLDPRTGELLRRERDDDCWDDDRSHGDDDRGRGRGRGGRD